MKIRKIVTLARTVSFILFITLFGLSVLAMDGDNLVFPIVCFVISILCFGISYVLDYLLAETGDKHPFFMH